MSLRVLIPGASGAIARKLAVRLAQRRARGRRHRPAALARSAHRVPRGRRAQARGRGRLPQGPAAGRRAHGDGDVARRAGRGALPDQPRRHARRLRVLARLRRRALHLRRPAHLLRRGARLAALPQGGRAAARAQPLPRARRPRRRRSLRRDGALALPRARDDASFASATRSGPTGHGTLASFIRGKRVPDGARVRPALPVPARGRRGRGHRPHASRSGRAASSTSPARSRCRSRASSSRPVARPCRFPSSSSRASSAASASPSCRSGALTHIKYPVVVDAKAFREATGFEHVTTRCAIASSATRSPPRMALGLRRNRR